jgi:acetylxylan esterase
MTRIATAIVSAACVAFAAEPAAAASLEKVEQSVWSQGRSDLPSYVNMYAYVPDQLATSPPIVVAPHHCQGTGQSTYSEMSSLVGIANSTGFILVFPEATGQNCWDAGSDRSLSHGASGDTGAIVQMVSYVQATYDADPVRVYAVGGSSGGIMTEALLGVYPDVFLAGVSLMGVPCGCWAEGYNDVTGNGSSAQWSGPCAGGDVVKTGQEWGDLVRSYFPEHTGPRPRLQHWHGTADTTLNYDNVAEDVKEWTNLLGLSAAPTGSDTPTAGTTREYWQNDCGFTVYETFSLSGVAHSVPFDGPAVAAYFGLDSAGTPDPELAACGSGGNGSGGSSGSGGGSAAGGSTGSPSGGGQGGTMPGTGGGPAGGGTASSAGGAGSGGASSGGISSGGDGPLTGSGSAPSASGGTGSAGSAGSSASSCSWRPGSTHRTGFPMGVLVGVPALLLARRRTRLRRSMELRGLGNR